MQLTSFFPTVVGNASYDNHGKLAEKLIARCFAIRESVEPGGQGWLSNKTYNTSDGKYELIRDAEFTELNEWVRSEVINYCDQLDIDVNLTNNGSWFNIYNRYDFQETHVHPTSSISAIYILACADDGARVFFNSPLNSMYHIKKNIKKQIMVDQIICRSIPGTLLVFPSYLPHAVERHESDQFRISLSYNYKHG